jgi:hypothetical protein
LDEGFETLVFRQRLLDIGIASPIYLSEVVESLKGSGFESYFAHRLLATSNVLLPFRIIDLG